MSGGNKPTAAFILSLMGGIFIMLGGLISTALLGIAGLFASLLFGFIAGGVMIILGILGIVWGILVILGAAMMYSHPERSKTWGAIVLVFSILSWFGALGGFFIGFILGLVGGVLGLTWSTPQISD